jgi:hypothetical protein
MESIAFNKALKGMIKDLIGTYPDCSQFKVCLVIYKMVKTINKKLPGKYYKSLFVDNYRQHILARDDSFLSLDILTNSDLPLNIKILVKQLDGVYDIWRNMDDANRAAVWDHLNLLVQLVDMMDLNRVGQ